jgi:hypothetical protein
MQTKQAEFLNAKKAFTALRKIEKKAQKDIKQLFEKHNQKGVLKFLVEGDQVYPLITIPETWELGEAIGLKVGKEGILVDIGREGDYCLHRFSACDSALILQAVEYAIWKRSQTF